MTNTTREDELLEEIAARAMVQLGPANVCPWSEQPEYAKTRAKQTAKIYLKIIRDITACVDS